MKAFRESDINQPIQERALNFGKYKFHRLKDVPDEYLKMIYQDKLSLSDELVIYIEEKLGIPKPTPLIVPCKKHAFPTKKEANFKLMWINKNEQEHKKPIRSYLCENCGQWHLTSKGIVKSDVSIKSQIKEWLLQNEAPVTGVKLDKLLREYNNHELPISQRLKQILRSRDNQFLAFVKAN